MSFFHHFYRGHGHHGHHGDHCGRGGRHGHRHDEAGSRIEHLADRLGSRLDLNDEQREHLKTLLALLQRQRTLIKGESLLDEVKGLMAGSTLDRAAAQALVDARIQALQAAGPQLIAALGDFYDALDADQQQALRFVLRLRGRFAGRGFN